MAKPAESSPCPSELTDPSSDVGHCRDHEHLIKVVELRMLIVDNGVGRALLAPSAIKQSDLSKPERSVSTLRKELTSSEEVQRRAKAINKQAEWADDPLIAVASIESLRCIVDRQGRREVCVFAEPTSASEDSLGPCLSHAGLKRSLPAPLPTDRLDWAMLRGKVAAAFSNLEHVCSNTDVTGGLVK